MAGAARAALSGAHAEAARMLSDALTDAPPGNGGWLLPVEPLLNVRANPDAWGPALARIKTRAA
jgi:hypothetical protein